MKQIAQAPGGRLYYGDDFLAMQQMLLDLTEKYFSQYGNIILHGCELRYTSTPGTLTGILPGVVVLDGKACTFAGDLVATAPYYVKQVKTSSNVPYKTGTGIGYDNYTAEPCSATDVGAFRLDGARRMSEYFMPAQPKWVNLNVTNVVATGGEEAIINRVKMADFGGMLAIDLSCSVPSGNATTVSVTVSNGVYLPANESVRALLPVPSYTPMVITYSNNSIVFEVNSGIISFAEIALFVKHAQ